MREKPQNEKTIVRRLVKLAQGRAGEEPVILLEGPRSSGKSTTIRALGECFGEPVLDFDNDTTREDAERDPLAYTGGQNIILIDEYQRVPAILDAVKVRMNASSRPGQFILTGSTRHDALAGSVQALTGRLHKMRLYPFAQSELEGTAPDMMAAILRDPETMPGKPPGRDTRESYISRIVRGGFPLAVFRAERPRNRWFDDYIRQTVERDIPGIARIRNKRGLLLLLRGLAAQTAQILTIEKIAQTAALDIATAREYVQLLEDVFMIHQLPAWGRTLGSRVSAKPKVHIGDSGIAARLLGVTAEKLLSREPAAVTEFGHLLETFAVMEIQKDLSWIDDTFLTGHWRTHSGKEVDFIIEELDGSVYGFEVKSAARVIAEDFEGLRALRKFAGPSFRGGFILYTGAAAYRSEEGFSVFPLCGLWQSPATSQRDYKSGSRPGR
jgi:predicted AAA+ superfamily ATPase